MAIDDKEKRAAVIGVGRPFMRDKFPVAAPDQEWRMSSGLTYGGNALTPGVAAALAKHRGFTINVSKLLRGG